MDRVHRPLRGGAAGRGARPRLGLPQLDRLPRRRGGREGRAPVRDRPAAVRGRLRARQGRSRQRRCAGQARRHRVPAGRRPRHQPGLLARELRPAAPGEGGCPGEPDGGPGGDGQGPARPRVHPDQRAGRRPHLRSPGRHRQSGDRGDAAHDDRLAEPDLLRVRHERGRLPRLPARGAGGRAALDPRPLDAGQAQARRRGRLEPARAA